MNGMNTMTRTNTYTAPQRRGFQGYIRSDRSNAYDGMRKSNTRGGTISNRVANRFIRQTDLYEQEYPTLTTNVPQNKVNYQENSWRDVITKCNIDNIVIKWNIRLNDIPFKDNSESAKVIPFNYNTLKNSMNVDPNEMDPNEMDPNDYTYTLDLGCDDWGGDWEYESEYSDDDNVNEYDNDYVSDGYNSSGY
jgi:hypothetical protein